jgi:hypothetical protein
MVAETAAPQALLACEKTSFIYDLGNHCGVGTSCITHYHGRKNRDGAPPWVVWSAHRRRLWRAQSGKRNFAGSSVQPNVRPARYAPFQRISSREFGRIAESNILLLRPKGESRRSAARTDADNITGDRLAYCHAAAAVLAPCHHQPTAFVEQIAAPV